MNGTRAVRLAITVFLVLLGAGLLPGCEDPHAAEKDAILAALRQLDEANEACDGPAAVAVMSSRGLDEYTRLVKMALDAPKADVQSLPPGEMQLIVELRTRLTRPQLEKMDGRAYQEYATGQCWYSGMGSDWEGSIGDIYVSGDTAYAQVLDDNGRDSGVQAHFEREDGQWKVNEFSLLRAWDDDIREFASQEGVTVHEMVVMDYEWQHETEVPDSVWEPMR